MYSVGRKPVQNVEVEILLSTIAQALEVGNTVE